MQLQYEVRTPCPHVPMVSIDNAVRIKLSISAAYIPVMYAVAAASLLVVTVVCLDKGLKGCVTYNTLSSKYNVKIIVYTHQHGNILYTKYDLTEVNNDEQMPSFIQSTRIDFNRGSDVGIDFLPFNTSYILW